MHTEEFLFFHACFQSGQSIQKGNALVSYRLAVVPQHSVVRNLVSKGRDENQIYLDLFAAQGWVAAEGGLVRTMRILAIWLEERGNTWRGHQLESDAVVGMEVYLLEWFLHIEYVRWMMEGICLVMRTPLLFFFLFSGRKLG